MDGHGERNSPKEAQNNAEMLLALLSHSEELRKGNSSIQDRVYSSFEHYIIHMSLCNI